MPKLRPNVTFPDTTSNRPATEMSAVTTSGANAGTLAGRTSGGPPNDRTVATVTAIDRSVTRAGRRTIVKTTTSASLTRSSSPVMCPVRVKSPRTLIDRSVNKAPTNARAARSRAASIAWAGQMPSRSRGGASATLGSTVHLGITVELRINVHIGITDHCGIIDKIGRARAIEQLARNHRLDAAVAAERRHLIQQVARMTRADCAAGREVMAPMQVRHHHRMERQLPANAVQLEYLRELLDGRINDRNLVGDAPQKRLVGQRSRIQVRRERDEDFERHLKLLSGMQRQVVDTTLERDDPTVEQVLRTDALPAETVDHEDATVRLELDRRLVESGERVERQLHHVEREFAADRHDGTPDAHPPPIARTPGDDAV